MKVRTIPIRPLKLFDGISKGRPGEKDLTAAKACAEGLKNKM